MSRQDMIGFKRYLQEQGLAKRTIETLLGRVQILLTQCEPFTQDTFFDFLLEYEQNYTAAATNKYIQAARHYCWYKNAEWGATLKQRFEDVRTPEPFTLEEIAKFFSLSCGNPNKQARFDMWTTLFRTLYLTGMRPKEVWQLKHTDVDYNRKLFRVKSTKTKLDRDLPIPDILLPEIEALIGSEYLFCKPDGKPLDTQTIYVIFQRRAKRAGLTNKKPYCFRHTFGTDLGDNGVGIYDIKILMGHKKISTTERYLHTSYKKLHKAVNRHSAVQKTLSPEQQFKQFIDDARNSGILDGEGFDYELTNDSLTLRVKKTSQNNYNLALAT